MKILISGGGTGGHIFPAISIANAVRRRHPETEILFVGATGRMEMEKVPSAGYDIEGLPVAGFDRKHLWRNFAVVIKLLKSMWKARKIIRRFRPDIAVGVGGYASGPMLKAAQKYGVPTLLQEQNSYAGVTNKLLAAKAKAICVAYPDMERFFPKEKIVMTGNPVRSDLLTSGLTKEDAKKALGFDSDKPLVLIVGGSLGARTINQSIAPALDILTENGIQIMWQCGKFYIDEFAYLEEGRKGVKIMPFISDMATAYKAADLVVARAGAGTISELQLLGLPSVLIPSPNVAEDHQTKNAYALSSRNAAVMISDKDAPKVLSDVILRIVKDEDLRNRLSKNVKEMALRDSDEKIVDEIDRILEDK